MYDASLTLSCTHSFFFLLPFQYVDNMTATQLVACNHTVVPELLLNGDYCTRTVRFSINNDRCP